MSDPQEHSVTLAVHGQRLNGFEAVLREISDTLKELKKLEIHHIETRNSIADVSKRCADIETLLAQMESRVVILEDIEKKRVGMMAVISFMWIALGGLTGFAFEHFLKVSP